MTHAKMVKGMSKCWLMPSPSSVSPLLITTRRHFSALSSWFTNSYTSMVLWIKTIVTKVIALRMTSYPILYSMYNIKQSMTTPYNPQGNSQCERFNHMLLDMIKTLKKEQKANWFLYVPSFVFTYNEMPHSITCYQPYDIMCGWKTLIVCDAWLGLASYNDRTLVSKCALVKGQHQLLMSANRQSIKAH